jgi:AcrR family transcriptional regulator
VTDPGAARGPVVRATQQRERILRAARRCFVRRGFHAASMADIAETAEMSPGLIYRYFPSKNAIVHAIIDREIEEARCILDRLGSAEDMVSAMLEVFERWARGDDEEMNAALFLEMVAVSARDEELAETMRRADGVIRDRVAEALRRGDGPAADAATGAEWCCRATMLQCLLEGLLVRAIRQPDIDRRMLRDYLDHAVALLKAWPGASSSHAAG